MYPFEQPLLMRRRVEQLRAIGEAVSILGSPPKGLVSPTGLLCLPGNDPLSWPCLGTFNKGRLKWPRLVTYCISITAA